MVDDAPENLATARDPAFDAIAGLLARGFEADLSEAEQAALDRLVAQTPGGREFADGLIDHWMIAGIAGAPRALAQADERVPIPTAVDISTPLMPKAPAQGRVRHAPWAAAAAVLVLLACGGAWWWRVRDADPETQAGRLIAAGDSPITMTLEDGSRLALSRDGQLRVAMDGAQRRLRQLQGVAYYEVAKDHHRPFSVDVAGYRVTALGTRFNVAPDPSGLKVDLLEGRLRIEPLRPGAAPVFITAGQSFHGGAHPTIRAVDPTVADWRYGRLVFDAVPLGEVARRLSRFSGRRVGIVDPAAGELRFSGVLRWDAPDDWAPAFEATLPVHIEPAPDGIEISLARK